MRATILRSAGARVVACLFLGSIPAEAAWTTNFTSLMPGRSGSAHGFWRQVLDERTGAGSDSYLEVRLITDGEVGAADGTGRPSRIDETFPWRNLFRSELVTLPDGSRIFVPSYLTLPFAAGVSGDFVSIGTGAGETTTVTIQFGAVVIDPMLSFSDIGVDTTIHFRDAFELVAGTSNLTATAGFVGNGGGHVGTIFERRAAGSLQFDGEFTELEFEIHNGSQALSEQTGFVVTTELAPNVIPEPGWPLLAGCAFLFCGRRRRIAA